MSEIERNDLVMCTNSHPVAVVALGSRANEYPSTKGNPNAYHFLQGQPVPIEGLRFEDSLCTCGAEYIRQDGEGKIQIHIASRGWV